MKSPSAKLIFAAGEHDADMRRLTGFEAPDPQLFVAARSTSWLLATDLEIDRAKREATVDHVVAWSDFDNHPPHASSSSRALKTSSKSRTLAETIAAFLRSIRVRSAVVPENFPSRLFTELNALGIRLRPSKDALFVPEREFKTDKEVSLIKEACHIAEAGIARAFEILRSCSITKNRRLTWGASVLTAESLRAEMEIACLRLGGRASGTIVACGQDACDPHERGHGPLRAGEFLILDIFPRATSGYFGDITRTVLKGRASDAQRALWHTVLEGQKIALTATRPGVYGGDIHERIVRFFASRGFPTQVQNGRRTGFFHGTGHGLGLELHEYPRFGATHIKPRQVFTIEPGLYYPGLGGVRHEDVVFVGDKRSRLLTKLEKPFEL